METQLSQTNGLAIASLVIGAISLPMAWCYGIGIPLGIVALVIGLIALRQIRSNPIPTKGEGLAIAGAILGGAAIAVGVLIILAFGTLILAGPQIGEVFSEINENLLTPTP